MGEEGPASMGGTGEPGPPLRVTGALSRTDRAEQLVSNGILVVSLDPSPSLRPTVGGGGRAGWGSLGWQFLRRIRPQGVW